MRVSAVGVTIMVVGLDAIFAIILIAYTNLVFISVIQQAVRARREASTIVFEVLYGLQRPPGGARRHSSVRDRQRDASCRRAEPKVQNVQLPYSAHTWFTWVRPSPISQIFSLLPSNGVWTALSSERPGCEPAMHA